VFDRFYRGRTSRPGGFGLGLPIARAVIEALEGDIEIAAAGPAGTTVRIRLGAPVAVPV
jgi:signal transduction histidine kinase